jgi:hypothetical protein
MLPRSAKKDDLRHVYSFEAYLYKETSHEIKQAVEGGAVPDASLARLW